MCAMMEKLRMSFGSEGIGLGPHRRMGWVAKQYTGILLLGNVEVRALAGQVVLVLLQDEIDPLADVLGDGDLGAIVQLFQPLVLLGRDVHRRRYLLPRHALT